MGARGAVPNRSTDLSRERDANRPSRHQTPITKGRALPATIPPADPTWHPIALMLWNACLESGQSDYYQSSDYALLYSICEDLSMYKKPSVNKEGEEYHKRSGQMLQTIYSALSSLLVTEGDRRRLRIELESGEQEEEASVAVMDDYRRQLGLVG